jgi:hypothetical protein
MPRRYGSTDCGVEGALLPQCAQSRQPELLARYSRVPSLVALDRSVDISRDLSMGACAISPEHLPAHPHATRHIGN